MEELNTPVAPAPKLLDLVRDKIRVKHYSIRTETQYVQWIKRFILFHGKRHPREMGAPQVEAFLTHLAVEGNVAASTQNQALSALLFLYREVLEVELPWLDNVCHEGQTRFVSGFIADTARRAAHRNQRACFASGSNRPGSGSPRSVGQVVSAPPRTGCRMNHLASAGRINSVPRSWQPPRR